jgi:hypothetical protein
VLPHGRLHPGQVLRVDAGGPVLNVAAEAPRLQAEDQLLLLGPHHLPGGDVPVERPDAGRPGGKGQALLAFPERLLRKVLLRDVPLGAPRPVYPALLDDAEQGVQEDPRPPVPVPLVGEGVLQPVAAADEGEQVLRVGRVGSIQELVQPPAQYLRRPLEAVHPGHRVVALGQVGVAVDPIDLLRLGQVHGERRFQLEAPDALAALGDEGPVALVAGTQGCLDAEPLRHVLDQDEEACRPAAFHVRDVGDFRVPDHPVPPLGRARETDHLALQRRRDEGLPLREDRLP